MSKTLLPKSMQGAVQLFDGARFDVYALNSRECIIHPGAVIILPLLKDTEVIMIRNDRFVVDECLWELPAGTLEMDEKPIDTAYRELTEETGYRANVMTPLLGFYTTPGFCNEKMHAFVAKDLEFVGQDLDPTERITAEAIPFHKVMTMIAAGTIHDGKTIATLLYYHAFAMRGG